MIMVVLYSEVNRKWLYMLPYSLAPKLLFHFQPPKFYYQITWIISLVCLNQDHMMLVPYQPGFKQLT